MSDYNVTSFGRSADTVVVQDTNRVLRNTYFLLALSMIPTALGATLGVQFGFFRLFAGSPLISFLVMMAAMFGFVWGIQRNKDNGLGVVLMLGFTFFMGLMLSGILSVALRYSNGGSIIAMASLGTGAIFFGLASYAAVTKRDFTTMGKTLFVVLMMVLVASVANIFLKMPALSLTISTLCVGLFSMFLLYDLQRVMRGGEDNYITAALAIYLDLYNLFVNLLQLLMAFAGGDRD
ncbi:Bax inhibitor-1/YccA family protein [Limnobacter humi]|uniref:Bax inhibitor-1/YccA family protein n=1 Tax=Limnobacter humi TaxID=1778671 RepID=A0ABT1WE98_9BURK|nr:Bax inhibitor-1/YccA family protein [Limnobacter humi]MCQ8895840.1 Bax inhibitor-1/YccA family protein [Limnobacter humi]